MAVTHHKSSRTIRGKTYAYGETFICYEANKGNGSSEGNGTSAAALTKGATYTFKGYAIDDDTGNLTAYPYLIADSLGNTRGWYKENVFPYAATYTISYNANGGSGAPASQTKFHGTNLTLSNTVPSKSGYTFKGWALTKEEADAGTWYYQPGATCGANKNLTLYAVWTSKSYTLSYNANGGTGAPASQTKQHGVDLKISSTKPTRAGYTFKGWASSATSATVVYNPGGTYIANISFTLYAVWAAAPKPTITNFSVYRCNEKNVEDDEGQYVFVAFDWSSETEATKIDIEVKPQTESLWLIGSAPASGTAGSYGYRINYDGGPFDLETTYQIRVTVTDANGSTSATQTVGAIEFPIDMRKHGVSFGRPATLDDTADFEYEIYARNGIKFPVLASGTDFNDVTTLGAHPFGAATTFGYKNCPISSATSGVLEVIQAGDDTQLLQRITTCSKSRIQKWERCYHETDAAGWGSWVRMGVSLPALTIYLPSNQTTVASDYTPIVFSSIGESTYGFTVLSDGSIKIGEGISYVLVSLTVCFSGIKANGNKHIKIKLNSSDYDWATGYSTTGGDLTLTMSPRLMKVTKDDVISATYYTLNAGETISAGNAANGYKTSITVIAVM